MVIETCYYSYKFDFNRFDLSSKQFTLLMNCTLGSTIYLGSDIVMTAGPFSHKSKFICHFRIDSLLREIVF